MTIRYSPGASDGYGSTIYCYMALNRFQEAKATYDQAVAHHAVAAWSHHNRYIVAFLEDDSAEMDRQVSWARGSAQETDLLDLEAGAAAFLGRMAKAREFYRLSADAARRNNQKFWPEVDQAPFEAELGNAKHVRELVATVLRANSDRYSKLLASIALARAGDAVEAQKITDKLKMQFPHDTAINYGSKATGAAIELSRNHPEKALQTLEPTSRYEYANGMYWAYLRGSANLKLHRGKEAAADFQEILDHRGVAQVTPQGALAHLGLARAYALQGDIAKAKAAYQDFLTLWKDADSDIPILQQAKSECANLK